MKFPPELWLRATSELPLPRLMQIHLGDGAHANKAAECPFCHAKGKTFGLFKDNGKHKFKCHKPGCIANDTGTLGHGEVAYIALRKNLSHEDAKDEFIKLALPQEYERIKAQQEAKKKEGDAKCSDKETPATAAIRPTSTGEGAAEGSTPPPAPSNVVQFNPSGTPPPPPPTGDQPPPPPPPDDEKTKLWDTLYRTLVLTPRDQKKLIDQRGYSEETITKLGFKSNNQSNKIHLEALRSEFPIELLIETGIYRNYQSGRGPNRQLLGWGLQRRAKKQGEDDVWGWTEPILIPYLREDGTCFHIRPHKGEIVSKHDDDEDEEDPHCASHVYCPFLLANTSATIEGTVVLTEGEFKAAAAFQCGVPILAIPGISFVRNIAFRAELLEIIRKFAITDLVVVFDNEVKDDPNFPEKYKADPNDRYDTQMWAEYIAIDLGREHFGPQKGRIRIGILPDNLRENGKADFDSILSYFVKQRRDVSKGTTEARKVFTKVIEQARPPKQARDLFPSESRRIIERKLANLFYKPNVPAGSDKELQFANACQAANEKEVARAYREIIGCYYDREKLPSEAERKLAKESAVAASRAREQAKAAGVNGTELKRLRTKERAAWEIVKGLPSPASNFIAKCEFKLFSPEGKADYLIQLKNKADAKWDGKLHRVTSEQLGRGPEWCCFVIGTGKGVWTGGARLLTALQLDFAHQCYMRDIYQVNFYGYHAESKLWFFGDCAFGPNGDIIEADKYNIFWHAGVGYQIDSSVSERGTTFEQGAPLMLSPHGGKPEDRNVGELMHQMCVDLYETIGGYDAFLMLGLIFAYAAAPELLRLGGHPSPWLFGKMSGGKTTIARWLMRIWGFRDLNGVGIDDRTTPVGMNRFLAQYSCLPVWFDEYRSNHNEPQKEAVLRGAFDRNSGAKGLADHSNRTRSAKIYTSPLVTGEASSSDAATRSRFGHINVNDRRRMGDGHGRFARVQIDCKHYYLIGQFIMKNRPKFVKNTLETLEKWMSDEKIRRRIVNERVRFVYATAWAAFTTVSRMFEDDGAEERAAMEPLVQEAILAHGEQALQDVFSETFLTRFWLDLISGLSRGKIKSRFFDMRHVIPQEDGSLKEVTAGDEGSIEVCYIVPKSVFDEYAQDLRSRGETPPLDLGDLRREMAKEPYWIAPPTRAPGSHRARINGSQQTCWVVNMERDKKTGEYIFPFGEDLYQILQPNSDDVDEVNNELAREKGKNGR